MSENHPAHSGKAAACLDEANRLAQAALSLTLAGQTDPQSLEKAKSVLLAAVRIFANQAIALQTQSDSKDGLAYLPQDGDLTATEVLVSVTALLKAVKLDPFELGMWQALG